jgi:hypothetical protein
VDDLAELDLPEGLREKAFAFEVGQRLLRTDILAAFDDFSRERRRFGEVTQWVKMNNPALERDHKDAQRCAQTLSPERATGARCEGFV